MPETTVIIGPPGTGKTTRLLDIMETELKNGISPNRIVFCSFTKKASEEATDRACDRFGFSRKDMVYFRTIHSLAFAALGLKKDNVMQPKDYKAIGNHLGMSFSGKIDVVDSQFGGKKIGDQYAFIDSFSRARHLSPKTVWDMMHRDNLNWFEYKRYADTLAEYKRKYDLYDFADMLVMGSPKLDVDVLIIDEAQDLSTAQWYFIEHSFPTVQRIYIGGDDDQAIFEWSGADVNKFINLKGKKEVLTQSYRIPSKVHDLATDISGKIHQRTDKHYASKKTKGEIEYWSSIDHIDMSSGTWLLLARNSYLLGECSMAVKQMGFNYAVKGLNSISQADIRAIQLWEQFRHGATISDSDREFLSDYTDTYDTTKIWHEAFNRMSIESRQYYVSLLRRGESLTKQPRINISTVHGAKGGEADHVVLLSDMATQTWEAIPFNPDSEHRVWYVGVTRCKETLNIIMPRGRYSYQL